MNKKELLDPQLIQQNFSQSIIPVLTDTVDSKPDFVLDIIEDFMPLQLNQNGHKEGCSCKACQPLKAIRNVNSVKHFTKPFENNLQPFRSPHKK